MTKSESWKTATEVYHAALEREESRRAAFLEEACAGDETLLREALSLLSGVARVELSSDSPSVDEAVSEVGFGPVSSTARPSGEGPALLGAGPGRVSLQESCILGRPLTQTDSRHPRAPSGGSSSVARAR